MGSGEPDSLRFSFSPQKPRNPRIALGAWRRRGLVIAGEFLPEGLDRPVPLKTAGSFARAAAAAAEGVAGAAPPGSRRVGNCAERADLPDNPAPPLEDGPALSAGSSVFFRTVRTRLFGETESDGGADAVERAFLCRFVRSSHRALPFKTASRAS
jgi:hypothetical protein